MQSICSQNDFCSLLTEAQRQRLCPHCIQAIWKKGQELLVPTSKNYATLIQSGLLACVTSDFYTESKTTTVYVSGDLLSYFAFAPASIEPMYPGTVTCIKDSSVIQFPLEIVRELFLGNPKVAKYMMYSSSVQQLRTQSYLYFVLQQDAYGALRYLLDFCKQHHVPRLTYEELAKISNLHRVTVTRTMKEILRSKDFQA